MKLFFDWCQSYNEEKSEWREDEEIISLEISQREGSFASAKISIFATSAHTLIDKKYAKIGVCTDNKNTQLLFTGRLVSFPIGFDATCVQLEFISEPGDYQQQLSDFSKNQLDAYHKLDKHISLKTLPIFDDLFFSASDISNNPTVFLEGNTKLFYWDMRTGQMSLSDINIGKNNIEISGDQILQNSLSVHLAREPYKCINISVSADWIQHSYGCIDLYPLIAQKFHNGVISSYTNIKKDMKNLCQFPHNSGYNLLEYKIKEIPPAKQSQFSEKYPTVSKKFIITNKSNPIPTQIQFRRFYFDGNMLIEWNHKQKRIETANIKIINTKATTERIKNINLKLNAIQLPKSYPLWTMFTYFQTNDKVLYNGYVYQCKESHLTSDNFDEHKWNKLEKIPDALLHDSQSSFFKSERGKNALKYAIQKAIALMNYSLRYIEISFSVNAKDFLFLTIDDTITITDSKFPNGRITGKITRTKFIGNVNHKIMHISVACCPYQHHVISMEKLNKFFLSFTIENKNSYIDSKDIVTNIEVKNLPEEQEQILSLASASSMTDLESLLKKHKTKIKVTMHPLNTMRVISNDIQLPDFYI